MAGVWKTEACTPSENIFVVAGRQSSSFARQRKGKLAPRKCRSGGTITLGSYFPLCYSWENIFVAAPKRYKLE